MSVDEKAEVLAKNEVCKRRKSDFEATSRLDESRQTGNKLRNVGRAVKKAKVVGQPFPQP